MKKNDFWFLNLIVWLIIGISMDWSFWICIVVSINAIIVLLDVVVKIYLHRKGKSNGE